MNESRDFFSKIKKHPERYYIVHYSSQSLYDDGIVGGLSPRITSIVVMQYATRQTVSFALHAIAEELDISRNEIEARYDDIELAMLGRFYTFAVIVARNIGSTGICGI